MASPDQPPHVPCLLPTAPLLLHLPRPLIPILLLLTRSRVRLPHPLPWLCPAGSILLPLPQSGHQSKSLPGTSHTHSQGDKQSELLPWPSHAHTQSVSQSLQRRGLSQLFAEISSHHSHSLLLPSSSPPPPPFRFECDIEVHVVEKQGLWSQVVTGQTVFAWTLGQCPSTEVTES